MKIPKEIAERVVTGSMKELWDTFINLEEEYIEYEKDYETIKYGIKIKFPIYWIWKGTNKIVAKPKSNIVNIDGYSFEEDLYETEKEDRRKTYDTEKT